MNRRLSSKIVLKNGNELAAIAASQIEYHLMGYFPISPSTSIPEEINAMNIRGENSIRMIPAEGEHSAFGICYGASTAGVRVFNATSANGLLYALEQFPVQSGTRFPMTLNVVTRSVSGPLDIKCDHSDIMMALNTGWIILFASNTQAIYDFNLCAPLISEHSSVSLPIIVAFDGYFSSHQMRPVSIFEDKMEVQNFVGEYHSKFDSTDPQNPITIGAHMDEGSFMENRFQLFQAMNNAIAVIEDVFQKFSKISGREYQLVEGENYKDADIIIFGVGSVIETCQMAVSLYTQKDVKIGIVFPQILRPFPIGAIIEKIKDSKIIIALDRQDTLNNMGGNLSTELKAAIAQKGLKIKILSRIYGLGGRDFLPEEVLALIEEAKGFIQGQPVKDFGYCSLADGVAGDKVIPQGALEPLTFEQQNNHIEVTMGKNGKLQVSPFNLRSLAAMPTRLGQGHMACNGCGIFSALNTFLKGIKGYVTVLFQTGCGMIVTTGYPYTSHRVSYVHNLFQNGAATLAGIVEAFHERKARGEISKDIQHTFIMFTGDGGSDIGLGSIVGAAIRNHRMIIVEYDNEGYMNTGNQLSYATPYGHMTKTSNYTDHNKGPKFHHKDMIKIMEGTNISYLFTGVESQPMDLIRKAAKAQWYAQNQGLVYGRILIACPLNWGSQDSMGTRIVDLAVMSHFFPLYEIEQGCTRITYDPDVMGKSVSIKEWLAMMTKTKHLLFPENQSILESLEQEILGRWERLKAKHQHVSF